MTSSFDDYPYLIHTNRELGLMLAGLKPLAVFVHDRLSGIEKSAALAGQDFASQVRNGRLSEHVRTSQAALADGRTIEVDYYLYVLEGEEWRVEAYMMLVQMMHRDQWCRQLEWLEGQLLGYTDEQNAYHIGRIYPTR